MFRNDCPTLFINHDVLKRWFALSSSAQCMEENGKDERRQCTKIRQQWREKLHATLEGFTGFHVRTVEGIWSNEVPYDGKGDKETRPHALSYGHEFHNQLNGFNLHP